jgi:hypothetical protein
MIRLVARNQQKDALMPHVVTNADLPFHELPPRAFESFIAHLMIRNSNTFDSVEHIGETGRDSGIDIIAKTKQGQRRVVVQAKRTTTLKLAQIETEIAKVRALPQRQRPYFYILATSATPSAATALAFHDRCAAAGIKRHELWNRSILTAKAVLHPDLIDYFFGTNFYEQFTAQRDITKQTLNHICHQAINNGIILLIGRSGEFSPDYPSIIDVDVIIETLLGSETGKTMFGVGFSEVWAPGVAKFLNNEIDSGTYYSSRSKIHREVDQSPPFRQILAKELLKKQTAQIPSFVRTLSQLMGQKIILGVVQLLPHRALGRVAQLSPGFPVHVYASNEMVTQTPFILEAGYEQNGLPRLDLDGSQIAARMVPALSGLGDRRPIFVAMNLSEVDVTAFESFARSLPKGSQLYLVGSTAPLTKGKITRVHAEPSRFLSLLSEASTSVRLSPYCHRLDFSGSPSIERIVYSAKLKPEDVKIAKRPLSLSEDVRVLLRNRDLEIREHSGSGKSTTAYFIALEFEALGYAVYILNCEELGETLVSSDDLIALLTSLAIKESNCLLILDDYQLISQQCQNFDNYWRRETKNSDRPYILQIISEPFMAREVIGGRIVRFQIPQQPGNDRSVTWDEERSDLFTWIDQKRPELSLLGISLNPSVMDELKNGQNMWHFFYLLRGGADKLAAELDEASRWAKAHVVWLVVCVRYHFLTQRPSTVDDIVRAIQIDRLGPAEIGTGNIGPWVSECLHQLVTHRLLVPVEGGVKPRHGLEAAKIVQLSLLRAFAPELARFQATVLRAVKKRFPPVELPPDTQKKLLSGAKYEVHGAIDHYLAPVVNRLANLQFGLIPWPDLQEYFAEVWSGFCEILQKADLHHLYWIFNRVPFSAGSLMFTPWMAIRRMESFTKMQTVSDAIDFSIVIKGLMGMTAITASETEYRYNRMLTSMEALANETRSAPIYLVSHLGRRIFTELESSVEDSERILSKKSSVLELIASILQNPNAEDDAEGNKNDVEEVNQPTSQIEALMALSKEAHTPFEEVTTLLEEFAVQMQDAKENASLVTGRDAVQLLAKIQNSQQSVAPIFENISPQLMSQCLTRVQPLTITSEKVRYATGVLAFAHLWLAHPAKASEVYELLPSEVMLHLESKVIDGDSYSDFHIRRESAIFQMFVKWLAERNASVAAYYEATYLNNEEGRSIDEDVVKGMDYLDQVRLASTTGSNLLEKDRNYDE